MISHLGMSGFVANINGFVLGKSKPETIDFAIFRSWGEKNLAHEFPLNQCQSIFLTASFFGIIFLIGKSLNHHFP